MNVLRLIEIAEELKNRSETEPDLLSKQVRTATQPNWPLEHGLQDCIKESADAIYFAETEVGYLNRDVAKQLTWW